MAYIDFEYYTKESIFNSVEDKEFHIYENKVEFYIKEKTLGKSDNYEGEELKRCVVELIDTLKSYDDKAKAVKGISSEKVGEYSVSYNSISDLESQKEKDMKEVLNKYLGLTGLLFRGV